jgi:uncharacterized OB-fold protein
MTKPVEQGPESAVVEGLKAGMLLLQRCRFTGEHYFYPRFAAVGLRPDEWDLVPAVGRGVVYAATRIDIRGDAASRYDVALVDLEEGPRLLARFATSAEQIPRPGTRVHVRIAPGEWAAQLGHPVPVLDILEEGSV